VVLTCFLFQDMRRKVMALTPFILLFTIGIIFELSQPWWVKLLLFAVLGGFGRLAGRSVLFYFSSEQNMIDPSIL